MHFVSTSLLLFALGFVLLLVIFAQEKVEIHTLDTNTVTVVATDDARPPADAEKPRGQRQARRGAINGTHGLPPSAIYETTSKTVMCVSAKGGSTSFYSWLYTVSTNGQVWSSCKDQPHSNYPQALQSCWQSRTVTPGTNGNKTSVPGTSISRVHRLHIKAPRERMSLEEQEAVIADPDVLWVAILRDPVERAISAWKSKLACNGW